MEIIKILLSILVIPAYWFGVMSWIVFIDGKSLKEAHKSYLKMAGLLILSGIMAGMIVGITML